MDIAEFSKLFDEKPKPLATKKDLENLNNKIETIFEENKTVKELKIENSALAKRLESTENRGLRKKITFWSIRSERKSNFVESVLKFCIEQLEIEEEIRMDRVHPEGRYDNRRGMIKAHIPRDSDINKIFSSRYKSASTNFSVQQDFKKEERDFTKK